MVEEEVAGEEVRSTLSCQKFTETWIFFVYSNHPFFRTLAPSLGYGGRGGYDDRGGGGGWGGGVSGAVN